MFNNYVEMLKKATEAMTSLHHTEAGPAEYFSAVGYEFAVIGLGILWLAIIVAVIAIPIVITKWVLNGKFATRKWKKFCSIWKDAKAIIKQRNDLEEDAKKIFTDVGEYKKEKKINHIMTNVYLILLYAVYAIFLIPLILIFI